jgi:hypothetical protein
MILLFGIINFVLILFQLSTGMRWIKVPYSTHKKTGIALLTSAVIHALLAILSS